MNDATTATSVVAAFAASAIWTVFLGAVGAHLGLSWFARGLRRITTWLARRAPGINKLRRRLTRPTLCITGVLLFSGSVLMLAAIADNNADSFNLLQHNPHESTKSSLLAYYASLALSGLGLGGLGIHYHFPDTKAFLRLTGASVTLGGFSQIPGRISSLVWLTGGLLLLATSLGGNTPGDGFFGPPDKANDQPIDSDTQPRE